MSTTCTDTGGTVTDDESNGTPGKPVTVESLQADYAESEWKIFEEHGLIWSVRDGDQEWLGPRSLILRVMAAETPAVLAKRLDRQKYLEGLSADALAAIYRKAIQPDGES